LAKNWAIVIGINQYEFLPSLRYAKRDAEAMRQFLESEAQFDRVFLFADDSPPIGGKLTKPFRSNLLRILRQISENPLMEDVDNIWFFFSGFGIRYNDRDYLMPSDADPEDIENTGIQFSYIVDCLSRSGVDNAILFVDACRNQDFTGNRQGFDFRRNLQEQLAESEQNRNEEERTTNQKKDNAHRTAVVSIFSCSPGEVSFEFEEFQQGVFTLALLEGLGERGRCATVKSLSQYLETRVPEVLRQHHKRASQTPCTVIEPANRSNLILMPRYATPSDINNLKKDAYRAESEKNLTDAKQLWDQVLAASQMMLSGSQRKLLREALMDAFPTQIDFEIMVDEELDVRLSHVVADGTYELKVFSFIEWAEAMGTLADVVLASIRANPNNRKLNTFFVEMRDSLIGSIEDENPSVRRRAAEALGNIGLEITLPALLQTLQDSDSDVRRSAVEALDKIGSEAAIPGLLKVLEVQDLKVRSSAAEAIGKISPSNLRVIETTINLLYSNQDYGEAIALLDRAIQFHSDNAELHARRGELCSELGRYAEGVTKEPRMPTGSAP
jgi:uncharacterized caspase-like protein